MQKVFNPISFQMPLNGKANPVARPSWLKDPVPAQTSATTTPPARPSWARKKPEAVKEESPSDDKCESSAKIAMAKIIKKESEAPKKDVTVKLQSREIKVPLKVEKTIAPISTQSILKKGDVKIKQDLKEEQKTLPLKVASKSPSKTPTPTLSSKSPSTTPSKSPSTTPSKSPSKTPDYDSDDDESSYESETDSSEEETDSDDDISDDEKPSYKPPSPGALKKHLVIPPLKKVSTTPEKSEPERPSSPDYTFKKPELKKVVTRQKSDAKERSPSPEPKFLKTKLRKVPSSLKTKEPPTREKLPVVDLKKTPPKAENESTRKMSEQFPHKPSILRAESSKKSEFKGISILIVIWLTSSPMV